VIPGEKLLDRILPQWREEVAPIIGEDFFDDYVRSEREAIVAMLEDWWQGIAAMLARRQKPAADVPLELQSAADRAEANLAAMAILARRPDVITVYKGTVNALQKAPTDLRDFGMTPQEAIDGPRAFAEAGELRVEPSYGDGVARALADLGHRVVPPPTPIGGAQAILIGEVLEGGSDPRKDGCAIGY